MKAARKIIALIDGLNRWAGSFAGWIGLLMVLVVVCDVIMRYLFSISYVFIQELEWHLFGVLFLSGAGYTLSRDSHVRVDVFYQRFSEKNKAWVNLLGVLFFLLPGCFMVIDTSWGFAANSFAIGETSPDPGGLHARYILKSFIPAGFALIFLQGISMALKSVLTIIGKPYNAEQEVG